MVIIIMGVSGAGKTEVGKRLAEELKWRFMDADEFHPPANIEKMRKGIPLNDDDRAPWLASLRQAISHHLEHDVPLILACSALKENYRAVLRVDPSEVRFVYLKGTEELIRRRMQDRQDHFFDPHLLASQFEDLEEPKEAIAVDIGGSPEAIVRQIKKRLAL